MDPQVGDMQSTAAPTTHSGDAAAVGSRSAAGNMENKSSVSPKPDHQRQNARTRLFTWMSRLKTPESVPCQVECYGQGNVHTKIMKLLKISVCEKPGIPLVLFVYKVSRETVDLRNALQWIEDNQGRKREDICAVILLEKSSDTDKKAVEVAHPGLFDEKTAVVRIRWKHRKNNLRGSSVKIKKGVSTKSARKIIKRSILGWQSEYRFQGSPAGGDV